MQKPPTFCRIHSIQLITMSFSSYCPIAFKWNCSFSVNSLLLVCLFIYCLNKKKKFNTQEKNKKRNHLIIVTESIFCVLFCLVKQLEEFYTFSNVSWNSGLNWIEILRFFLALCVIVVIHLNKLFIQILKKKYKKENCFWGRKKEKNHGSGGVAWVFATRTEKFRGLTSCNRLGKRY